MNLEEFLRNWAKNCDKCCMSYMDPFNEYNFCPRCGTKIEDNKK